MDPAPATYKEERPWGSFELFIEDTSATVKLLTIKAGEAFSLQYHNHRDETWRILSGSGEVTIGEERKSVSPGETYHIPRGTIHRAHGGDADLHILEIALGEFDENDIVRLEDKYGRSTHATGTPSLAELVET